MRIRGLLYDDDENLATIEATLTITELVLIARLTGGFNGVGIAKAAGPEYLAASSALFDASTAVLNREHEDGIDAFRPKFSAATIVDAQREAAGETP